MNIPNPFPSANDTFGGVAFQITPVRGVRAFVTTIDARLRGVHRAQVWTAGENLAYCRRVEFGPTAQRTHILCTDTVGPLITNWHYYGNVSGAVDPEKTAPHDMASCTCGFYGYLDGSADFYSPGMVEGVIEAYGRVHLGTRGFRASKARIVAICMPNGQARGGNVLERRLIKPITIARYYGVPIFFTRAEMLAAFPTDEPEPAKELES